MGTKLAMTSQARELGVSPPAGAVWPADLNRDPTAAPRKFWTDDDRFFAMTSLGGIVPGHALICPTPSLVLSTGGRSCYDVISAHSLVPALMNAVGHVESLLKAVYGDGLVLFEHGSHRSAHCASSCGTAFPHIHAIPRAFQISQQISALSRWRYDLVKEHASIAEFYGSPRGPGEYWVISDASSTIAVWSGEDRVLPSQMLRKYTQATLGLPINRWQDDMKVDAAIGECNRLRLASMICEAC